MFGSVRNLPLHRLQLPRHGNVWAQDGKPKIRSYFQKNIPSKYTFNPRFPQILLDTVFPTGTFFGFAMAGSLACQRMQSDTELFPEFFEGIGQNRYFYPSKPPSLALSGLWGGEGGGACGVSPKLRARPARFILLGSFSDNLLVVSILDIVYNCHLQPVLQS